MKPAKFRILLYDTKYRNPNHYICLAILGALKRHPDVEFVAKADPLDAMSIANNWPMRRTSACAEPLSSSTSLLRFVNAPPRVST